MAFNWLKNALTGIPRGVGQLLQGKPRGAIGAFSDTVKPLAVAGSAIPGPWTPFAVPLAAAAGAGQKFDDEGRRGLTDILRGGVEGGSMALGARGVGNLARSGISALGGGGVPGAIPTPDLSTAVTNTSSIVSGAPGGVGPSVTGPGSTLLSRVGDTMSGIGSYFKDNPEIGLGIAKTGLGYMSERERGGAMDEWRRVQEEDMERLRQLQELQALFSLYRPTRF